MVIPICHEKALSSWGNYPVIAAKLLRPERYRDLQDIRGPYIPRGLGRSYGDAALLSEGSVVVTERLDRILDFDEQTGVVRAEAGVSLEMLLEYFLPRGWFLPVTPGTKYVTLGGCVAADVHGKNHHVDGSFGNHVLEIELMLPDGSAQRCSPSAHSDLFWATVGGMGLTGMITEVTLQLHRVETSYIVTQHRTASNLEEAMRLLSDNAQDDKYSVAWIDCLATGENLGRSIVLLGHHARVDELDVSKRQNLLKTHAAKGLSVPITPPFSLINSWSVRMFNGLYYRVQSQKSQPRVIGYDGYFYPLDAIGQWNRVYGKKGFVQYQFVLPTETSATGLKQILELLSESKRASFLAVLKRFGAEGLGLLSFPIPGYTLALDLAITDDGLFTLLDKLDELVLQHQGRVYLAKDARMKAEVFREMYPRLPTFEKLKAQIDPQNHVRSDLSLRLRIGGQP